MVGARCYGVNGRRKVGRESGWEPRLVEPKAHGSCIERCRDGNLGDGKLLDGVPMLD